MIHFTKLFIEVLKAFVSEKKINEELKVQFTPEVLQKLFDISNAHDVSQIVADVLFKNELLPKDEIITEKFYKSQLTALYRYSNIEHEQKRIFAVFEKYGIQFVPLKGTVIREYYTEPYMRTSCDIDVLIKESDLRKAEEVLVKELKYTSKGTVDFHDLSLFSESGVHLELHYNLKEKRDNLDNQLIKVWDFCVDTDRGAFYKLQTVEFYIFYHIAHMVNHFLRGGCGIRAFVDLYFIKNKMKYDENKLSKLLQESGIEDFFNAAMYCVSVWFENELPSETSELIENFVLHGGVYGTKENRLKIEQNKRGGKILYVFSRLFTPYDALKYRYPILQKHKILLPFVWVVRFFSLISPKKIKRAKRELKIQKRISNVEEDNLNRMIKLLKI